MGVVCTSHYRTPIDSNLIGLSSKHYRKFPRREKKAKGEVIMQLTGEGLSGDRSVRRLRTNAVAIVRFHRQCPCTFAPQDDSVLIYGVTVEPFSVLDKKPRLRAKLRKWDLSSSPSTSVTRVYTIKSGPWSISPNGKLLSCLSSIRSPIPVEDLYLAKCDTEPIACVPTNLLGCVTGYRRMFPQKCPVSPDGRTVASMRNINGVISIAITRATTGKVLHVSPVSNACKGLRGVPVNCQFSPDSQFLAVTSSFGQVYIIRRSGLLLYQKLEAEEVIFLDGVVPDLTPSEAPAWQTPCTLDFDPRFPRHVFATCSFHMGLVRIWRISSDHKREVHCEQSLALKKPSNIIKYSPDGALLAIGDHESSISFVNPDDGAILFILKTWEQQPEFQSQAGVFHIDFSRSGEQLVASYSDAFIRVWQLPAKFDLQHLCRLVINTCVSPRHVNQLTLPWRMKKYLLFEHF